MNDNGLTSHISTTENGNLKPFYQKRQKKEFYPDMFYFFE
jgi:hypothetical protein